MNIYKYDYLLVGAGLFNAVFANEAQKHNKKCLVIEKRKHIGGNLYCENIEGINIHKYGPHIFHTSDIDVWNYMLTLCKFNHFIYSPIAKYKDEIYNLPFNMNTFYQLWKLSDPNEVKKQIKAQSLNVDCPNNLEEEAISKVGYDIYEKLIKGYTEKQWGKLGIELPAFIIKRLPIRFTYDNNYYNDPYQGIPIGGYNCIFSKCFQDCEILVETDYLENLNLGETAKHVVYTGMIDQYYNYCYGQLEYRSLYFTEEILDVDNYQGNAVVNYTEKEISYTRIIEHKHFEFGQHPKSIITKEYPQKWRFGLEPFYPLNTEINQIKYKKYIELANKETDISFGGRLGHYKYYNMDQVVKEALSLFHNLNNKY